LSNQLERRISEVEGLSKKVILLDCTEETASIYGKVKSKLKNRGTKIPENDIWIASIAIQHQLTLLTNDKHFDYVEGLSVESIPDS
jgi:tRNA(fMet)-specific endonuclease VapC